MTNVDIIAATALQSKFNKSQIFHDEFPDSGTYPAIVYSDVTETRALSADDKVWAKEHIIRVTIVTNGNSGINALKQDVEDCMTEAGFLWENTGKVRDKNEYFTSLDFSYSYKV